MKGIKAEESEGEGMRGKEAELWGEGMRNSKASPELSSFYLLLLRWGG